MNLNQFQATEKKYIKTHEQSLMGLREAKGQYEMIHYSYHLNSRRRKEKMVLKICSKIMMKPVDERHTPEYLGS